ncbi:hypothetical protein ACO3TA_02945 [Methanocaldococcus sp. 28A]
MNDIRLLAIKSFNEFINEVLRINPRIYRVEDYTRGFIEAMSNNIYLETISKQQAKLSVGRLLLSIYK